MSYDHKIIQNFKKESKNATYKVLCSGLKCPILAIIRDEYLSLMIVKMRHFTPEWGQSLVCYVMIRIHAYLESAEPPDYGHQKQVSTMIRK